MNRTGDVPYTWEALEAEIREAICAQASVLYEFGPGLEAAAFYLGIDLEDDPADLTEGQLIAVDLDRHGLHHHARVAFDYAFGPSDGVDAISTWHATDGILQAFPETDANGTPSPFCTLNDFPLRRMFETFFARFALFEMDWDMTIRQLALLSNMTVQAVRNSLSKEGYKLQKVKDAKTRSRQDDAGFKLAAAEAKQWLMRRRGFIQRTSHEGQSLAELFTGDGVAFPEALARSIDASGKTPEALAVSAGLDPAWIAQLLSDGPAEIDIAALRRLAEALSVPTPRFVAKAVENCLSR